MKQPQLLTAIAAAAMLMTSCASDEPAADNGFKPAGKGYEYVAPIASRASLDLKAETIKAYNEWAFKMLGLTAESESRFAFSPASLAGGLALMASSVEPEVGAMVAQSGGATSVAELETTATALMSYLTHESHKSRIFFANSVWNDIDITLTDVYRQYMAKTYGASSTQVNFASDEGVAIFMGWVSDNTEGLINHINAPLIRGNHFKIANTFYFESEWATPFDKAATTDDEFIGQSFTTKVPTMHGTINTSYYTDDDITMVTLPYAGDFTMCLIIPGEDGPSVREVAANLTFDRYKELTQQFSPCRATIALPRFEINAPATVSRGLTELGYPSSENIEFRLGADVTTEPVSLNAFAREMRQDVYISVNETGTKAAALTHNGTYWSTGAPEIEVKFDHPFIFLIMNSTYDLPVMAGVISDIRDNK